MERNASIEGNKPKRGRPAKVVASESPVKKRGRPPKAQAPVKKPIKRGRPPKAQAPVKKPIKRGRPPKAVTSAFSPAEGFVFTIDRRETLEQLKVRLEAHANQIRQALYRAVYSDLP